MKKILKNRLSVAIVIIVLILIGVFIWNGQQKPVTTATPEVKNAVVAPAQPVAAQTILKPAKTK